MSTISSSIQFLSFWKQKRKVLEHVVTIVPRDALKKNFISEDLDPEVGRQRGQELLGQKTGRTCYRIRYHIASYLEKPTFLGS